VLLPILVLFDYIGDIFLLLDIFLRCFTPLIIDGFFVTNSKKIREYYWKRGTFVLGIQFEEKH
jgi:hypothetical protein